jgi:ABC-type branched-subunit amino acid transport system ATPase component
MGHKLEVDSIILEFGHHRVLQDVYFTSETGKITGILGRNGCGKSCLMNIIYGVLPTTDKSIRIDGKPIFDGYRDPQLFRYLPQFNFIPKDFTVRRIFSDFGLDFASFINWFPEFEKFHQRKLGKLSGGERRIVEVYAILAAKTKFCMLDEPFSHIMPLHVEVLKNIMLEEKKNKGIIITDHMHRYITEISDHLYVITNGKAHLTKEADDLKRLGYLH